MSSRSRSLPSRKDSAMTRGGMPSAQLVLDRFSNGFWGIRHEAHLMDTMTQCIHNFARHIV